MNNFQVGKNYLITTDDWFYAPNGKKYKSVWGKLHGAFSSEETLGVKTNAKSTNWYVQIGNMTLAGCRIHYIVRADKVSFNEIFDYNYSSENVNKHHRPTEIYNADEIY